MFFMANDFWALGGAPPCVLIAARNVREWARLNPSDSVDSVQMFYSFLAFAGGDVADFDWLLVRGLAELRDLEWFLEAGDEFVTIAIMLRK